MHDTDAVSKAAVKAAHGLIGQGNLRDQHNGLLSLQQHMVDQGHVDFCLAAACDTMDETWSVVSGVIGSNKIIHNGLLLRIQKNLLTAL